MSGDASDPIWDMVPVGTPGPAVFDPAAHAVVQSGHTVLWDVPMSLKDLEVEAGGTLRIATGASLALYGSAQVNGTLAGDPGGELVLVGDGPVSVVSTAPLDLWHLTVDVPGGAFADADLAVRGTLQLTTGDLTAWGSVTLVSDADGTGRLGPVGDEADLVGALTVQRYIPAGGTNWRLLGSPVAGRTVADWMDDFYTAGFPGSHWPEFYDTWNGAYAPGAQYWPSVRQFMEQAQTETIADGLIGVESQNTPLATGIGFAAWCGDTITGTGAFTVDVTGTPHIARTPLALPVSWTPQTPAAPALQGWNLLSNPLPSPVAFGQMDRGADVANGYYVYDPATGNNAYWDAELGLSVPEQALDGTIHSSQGFWVKAD
ncbi:MAG: hypothetical protein RBT71_11425, partial [Flavobacteriales bacterium]|nr:hypothetical protein [Flavobacteriales bacterium]